MKLEKAVLMVLIPLTIIIGFCLFLDYFRIEFSLLFCLIGLLTAGILLRDEKNWKIGAIFLFLTCAVIVIKILMQKSSSQMEMPFFIITSLGQVSRRKIVYE